MSAPCGWFDATPVGRIVNRFSQDISTVVSNAVVRYHVVIVFCSFYLLTGLGKCNLLSTVLTVYCFAKCYTPFAECVYLHIVVFVLICIGFEYHQEYVWVRGPSAGHHSDHQHHLY